MKFSRSWLADYVDLPAEPAGGAAELAAVLTAAGLAVEYVDEVGDDVVLDIDITTNRVDAMCHLGLAREVSALTGAPLKRPDAEPAESGEPASEVARVVIEDPRCARYAARVVRGVTVGPSPKWLQKRLAAIGSRPINNVVDVTNYVLWEMGQPLHAFDLATLEDATIRVRAAEAGEALVTLDGETRRLDPEILLIADARHPVALAGIMGGLATEVTEGTADVLIESAHFEPRAVRRGARRLGMHTDASHRFERGADPEVCAEAASRAAVLLAELTGGTVLPGVVDVRCDPEADWRLPGRLELGRLNAFLGVEVTAEEVKGWLTRLGFELTAEGEGAWRVRVPPWRYYDFQPTRPTGEVYAADLYEEVARLKGLDAIPATLPAFPGVEPPPSPGQVRRRRSQDLLAAAGYAEIISYAFHDAAAASQLPSLRGAGQALELANPLSELYAVMRRSLVPGLVAAARFNQRRGASAVRLFEVGHVFFPEPGSEAFPDEVEAVGMVAGGVVGSPWQRQAELDLFDLKGAVESLAEAFGRRLEARPAQLPGLVPGASARLYRDGATVGYLGQVAGDDPFPLFAAELDLAALDGRGGLEVEMPSRHPGVSVDLTFTHPVEVAWNELAAAIEEISPDDLRSFALKDRYRGKGVPAGAVNTTIAFAYNAAERSLTQEEVNERHTALAAELARRFGWRGEGGQSGPGAGS